MSDVLYRNCPSCGSSWRGDLIPETSREFYGGSTHFSRLVGIYSRERDRTVAWQCPDCGEKFDRNDPRLDDPDDTIDESLGDA